MSRIEKIGDCSIVGFPKVAQIYAIEGEGVVYIGSTINPIKNRVRAHIRDARNGSLVPVHQWMRERDYAFIVRFIESVDERLRVERERFWIERHLGLLNLTDGGAGLSGHKFAGTQHAARIASKIKTGSHYGCLKCGMSFWRKRNEIIKGNNKYCSRKCANGRHK